MMAATETEEESARHQVALVQNLLRVQAGLAMGEN